MVDRLIAYKIRVVDLLNGDFSKGVQEFEPDFIAVNGIKVSRVNLMGFVVGKNIQANFEALSFDDGTAVIEVRNFGSVLLDNFDVGDCINIIGKVKEYGSMRYVVCESCKTIDKDWLDYRKKELELVGDDFVSAENLVVEKPVTEQIIEETKKTEVKEEPKLPEKADDEESNIAEEETIEDEESDDNPIESLLKTIRKLDEGDGVDVDELVKLKGDDIESLITTLLGEGELFEVKPGRVKVLE